MGGGVRYERRRPAARRGGGREEAQLARLVAQEEVAWRCCTIHDFTIRDISHCSLAAALEKHSGVIFDITDGPEIGARNGYGD